MIERLYLKELVTFDRVELEFTSGLVVLTGASGAGKSVLMSAILASFGYQTLGSAALSEVTLQKPQNLTSDLYDLEDEVTIKKVKKEKIRHYIEGQHISKKALYALFSPYVKYLSVRDQEGVDSETLLGMLDSRLQSEDKTYKKLYKEYDKRYKVYKAKAMELQKIKEDESKRSELIEYTKYEIEKIASIAPKVGEDTELLQVKQQLSRIDKVKDALAGAEGIFAFESKVEEIYRLLEKESTPFSEMMNQLRVDFDETQTLAETLEETDVEGVLNRLEDITALQNRYGSIEEALAYQAHKSKALEGYENIEQDKSMLESFLQMEYTELMVLASKLSTLRQKHAVYLEEVLAGYLKKLKLPALHFEFSATPLSALGIDSLEIFLGDSKASTLSGGEFNRVRLALMVAMVDKRKGAAGVLILDEIDANVSGDESIAIADMIGTLASVYQIFAISHQPHLSAIATQHIVVRKGQHYSEVEILDDEGRIIEIARIIAGENPTNEAIEFAKKLRGV